MIKNIVENSRQIYFNSFINKMNLGIFNRFLKLGFFLKLCIGIVSVVNFHIINCLLFINSNTSQFFQYK